MKGGWGGGQQQWVWVWKRWPRRWKGQFEGDREGGELRQAHGRRFLSRPSYKRMVDVAQAQAELYGNTCICFDLSMKEKCLRGSRVFQNKEGVIVA